MLMSKIVSEGVYSTGRGGGGGGGGALQTPLAGVLVLQQRLHQAPTARSTENNSYELYKYRKHISISLSSVSQSYIVTLLIAY